MSTKTHIIEDQLEEIALPASTRCELTNGWYVDSGATRHMTFQKNLLLDFVEFNKPSRIYLGDNRVISATGEGKVKIPCIDGANKIVLTLEKVLFVPELTENLSVSSIAKNGGVVKFGEQRCIVSKERTLPLEILWMVNYIELILQNLLMLPIPIQALLIWVCGIAVSDT